MKQGQRVRTHVPAAVGIWREFEMARRGEKIESLRRRLILIRMSSDAYQASFFSARRARKREKKRTTSHKQTSVPKSHRTVLYPVDFCP